MGGKRSKSKRASAPREWAACGGQRTDGCCSAAERRGCGGCAMSTGRETSAGLPGATAHTAQRHTVTSLPLRDRTAVGSAALSLPLPHHVVRQRHVRLRSVLVPVEFLKEGEENVRELHLHKKGDERLATLRKGHTEHRAACGGEETEEEASVRVRWESRRGRKVQNEADSTGKMRL